MTPEDLFKIVATPTRLGCHLAPQLWGYEAKYDVDPWLALTEQKVMDCVLDRTHQRFIRVHVPPQVGKTSFSGGFLPFWILGMFPDTRIIFITYSDDYSRLRGGEVRDMIAAFGLELFGIEIDPTKDAAGDWRIKGHRGGMLSVGIGSQIAGRSGDIVIIDDVIKNMTEAASVATKSLHVRDYDANIRGRLQPGGTMIMTSTRWADDDLAGTIGARCKAPGYRGDQWEELTFPAIAEPSDDETMREKIDFELWEDELGRKYGEPLGCRFTDPDLPWDDTVFYTIRRSSDAFTFSCLFQQNPVSSDAGMFPPAKWGRYRQEDLPKMLKEVRIWDPAATEGGGDWSVGVKVGKGEDGKFYILDVWRDRLAADAVLEKAKQIGQYIDGYQVEVGVEQERAGAGKSVIRFWTNELAKAALRVFPCKAEGTKEDRAVPASTLQQAGRLMIPHEEEDVEWVPHLVDQARRMMGDGRRGVHDDIVDGFAHGVLALIEANAIEFWDPSALQATGETFMESLLFH